MKEKNWESDKQTDRKTDKQRENKSNSQKALYDIIDLLSEDKNYN